MHDFACWRINFKILFMEKDSTNGGSPFDGLVWLKSAVSDLASLDAEMQMQKLFTSRLVCIRSVPIQVNVVHRASHDVLEDVVRQVYADYC